VNPKKPRPLCANACGRGVSLPNGKFCSLRCNLSFRFATKAALLEAGKYPLYINSRFLRKYLIERFGERCSRCGWNERNPRTGRIPVEVEHIDGDWRNNSAENLTLLCPNCHSLTPTFRALNRGRGRPMRLGARKQEVDLLAPTPPRSELSRREVPAVPPRLVLALGNADVAERLKARDL
jgi:hypothetical protein